VEAFALRAEEGEAFCGLRAGVGDAVREAGVELGDLSSGEDQVPLLP
jgi:hypothetical protein